MTTTYTTARTYTDVIVADLVETYRVALAASERATDFSEHLYWSKIASQYAARIARYGVDVEAE